MKNIKVSFDFTFSILLTILFIVLKGIGLIDWAWGWIISPIWISILIILLFIIIYLAYKLYYLFGKGGKNGSKN